MKYFINQFKDHVEIKTLGKRGRPAKKSSMTEALEFITYKEELRLKALEPKEELILKPYLMEAIEEHVALARSCGIKRYNTAPHALDRDEMISVAYWGLCDAARRWEKYCESKGYSSAAMNYFTTYAYHRIRGAVEDFIRQQDWATRSLRERSKKLIEAGGDRGATRQELSERTGMSLQEVHEVVAGMSRAPVSLNVVTSNSSVKINAEDATEAYYYHPELTEPKSVESEVGVNTLLGTFADAVSEMSEEAQIIVGLHYYKNLELKKIASILDITEARASQVHTESALHLLEVMKDAAS